MQRSNLMQSGEHGLIEDQKPNTAQVSKRRNYFGSTVRTNIQKELVIFEHTNSLINSQNPSIFDGHVVPSELLNTSIGPNIKINNAESNNPGDTELSLNGGISVQINSPINQSAMSLKGIDQLALKQPKQKQSSKDN